MPTRLAGGATLRFVRLIHGHTHDSSSVSYIAELMVASRKQPMKRRMPFFGFTIMVVTAWQKER